MTQSKVLSGAAAEGPPTERVPDIRAAAPFSRFFRTEWPKLRNWLRRHVGAEDAEDLAQEAFARVFAAKGEIEHPSGLLYQTARNLLINKRVQQRAAHAVMLEGGDGETVPDPAASPEDLAHWRRRIDDIVVMIERMSPRTREAFLLQVRDACSYSEIAAKMGISVAGVKVHLQRAFDICAAHALPDERRDGRRGQRPKRKSDET